MLSSDADVSDTDDDDFSELLRNIYNAKACLGLFR